MPRFLSVVLVVALVMAQAVPAGAGGARRQAPDYVPDELLVAFQAGLSEGEEEDVYRVHGGAKLEKLRGINVHRIRVPAAALEATERMLARHPHVKFVERNQIFRPHLTANDPYFGNAWHLPKIAATQAWDVTTGSPGIVVAILDSGVDATHPDLAAKMVAGYNFYDNNSNTADVYGHGTNVAGSATAISNNGTGVTSVAWQTKLMPIRVTDTSGWAYTSTLSNGLTWAVDHGARVMNMSFGGVAGNSTITSAAQYVVNKGGVVVAAAGNCGCVDSTADNPYMISVSATTSTDALASWSSRGPYVDVAAPGEGIYTTARGGGYASVSGTSFASPVTAGVIALMLSVNPSLTPANAEALLQSTADDLGTAGWDQSFGYGRINASRAVTAAAASAPPPDTTPPTASVTSPAAGSTVSGQVTVSASADDNTSVARVELYVNGALQATDSTSPYGFAWDTTKLLNGSHTLAAVAYDAAGNAGASANVAVTVGNFPDTTPPSATITSAAVSRGKLNLGVSATDNVAVVKVELYIDGALKTTDSTAPWSFSVNLKPYATGTHTAQAKAYDAAGNWSLSAPQAFVK